MRTLMAVLKALADENRVRIVMALKGRELCVCQITELLGLAQSTVSKHMAILRQARLVEARKAGRWVYYRGPDSDSPPEARATVAMLGGLLKRDKRIRDDERSLKRIQEMDPEELCRKRARSLSRE